MDKTINLVCSDLPVELIINRSAEEAREYLKQKYNKDIIYKSFDDSFIYRGIEFDYFASGFSPNKNKHSYLLVDKDNPEIWLFDYGDLEERWISYLKEKQNWVDSKNKKIHNNKNWLDKFIDWLP